MSRTRTPRGTGPSGRPTRLGSLRTALLVLAVVPCVALVLLWALSSARLFADWKTQSDQDDLVGRVGDPANRLYYAFQDERLATARALTDPAAAPRLRAVRAATDTDVRRIENVTVPGGKDTDQTSRALYGISQDLVRLDAVRSAADHHTLTQDESFTYYTILVSDDLRVFGALSHAKNGDVVYAASHLYDLYTAGEMLSREQAALARPEVTADAREQLAEWIGTQHYLFADRVVPALPPAESDAYLRMTGSADWEADQAAETALLRTAPPAGDLAPVVTGAARTRWLARIGRVEPQLRSLMARRTDDVDQVADSTLSDLLTRLVLIATIGLAAVVLVVLTSARITGPLRRRILTMREDSVEMQTRMPAIMERARAGEDIDLDAEFPDPPPGGDELTALGLALSAARRRALHVTVQQGEQQRGFERLLQRVARRTQLLIGLQLKKLDQLERLHEDPELLEGLFDLDHLTARLRRYEESLVILSGGQPQRRWRRPVPLLDVLRAAQGEVQDYRRVRVESHEPVWISERAVGPLVHMLAELMENGTAFSRPPLPVDVRATLVGRGLSIEIEDRGLGMEAEQYQEINAMLAAPPEVDVVSRAEDIRFGLFVVARLAAGAGVGVELRPSVHGGTRVTVHLPAVLVVDAPAPAPAAEPAASRPATAGPVVSPPAGTTGGLPTRARGRAMSQVTAPPAPRPAPADDDAGRDPGGTGETAGADPGTALPRRVRQASLAAGLRDQTVELPAPPEPAARPAPRRSAAALGAFQRQSRRAHTTPPHGTPTPAADDTEPHATRPTPRESE